MKKLSLWRKRKIEKEIKIEILETLCTICLYLADDSNHSPIFRRKYYEHFEGHFRKIKDYSMELRGNDNHTITRNNYF